MKFDLSVGEQFQGGNVVALHAQESLSGAVAGIVLTYRDYQVWTVFRITRTGDVVESFEYIGDMDAALLLYSSAVTAALHTHFGRTAPGVTFLVPNTQ